MPATPGALPEWSRAHGAPLFAASIRDEPSDFRVTENPGFELSGSGEHDYLWVEKVGANTDWVARQLARHAGVRPGDVGYSGMKDRHAITQQWFSVPGRGGVDWESFAAEGVSIRAVRRHDRKAVDKVAEAIAVRRRLRRRFYGERAGTETLVRIVPRCHTQLHVVLTHWLAEAHAALPLDHVSQCAPPR